MSWPHVLPERLDEMYALYREGNSLAQVGVVFGCTRQSVFGLFQGHKLPTRGKRKPLDFVEFNGNKYTIRDTGYYGRTNKDRTLLHRDMWEFHNGPIPDGWDVHHKDENKLNNVPTNFECLLKADHTRLHPHGQNQHTVKRRIKKCE